MVSDTNYLRRLRSPGVAVVTLVMLAGLSALGTLLPPGATRRFIFETFGDWMLPVARAVGLVGTYRSPLFIALLLVLTANVLACSLYRAFRAGGGWRRIRRWADLALHVSLVLVALGGSAKAIWGAVGTQYLFMGTPVDIYHDPSDGTDHPLGFAVLLRERRESYYPVRARLGIKRAGTGEKVALVEAREGSEVRVPGTGLSLRVTGFDGERQLLRVRAADGPAAEDLELDTVEGGGTTARFGDHTVTLVAWRRDLRNIGGRVSVFDGGREAASGWISPQGGFSYRGVSLYLIAWGEDDYGNEYLGVQVSRDPAAPLFWAGCILLALAAPALLLTKKKGS